MVFLWFHTSKNLWVLFLWYLLKVKVKTLFFLWTIEFENWIVNTLIGNKMLPIILWSSYGLCVWRRKWNFRHILYKTSHTVAIVVVVRTEVNTCLWFNVFSVDEKLIFIKSYLWSEFTNVRNTMISCDSVFAAFFYTKLQKNWLLL